jgi:predicted translin family RNA/ssDNA-binding protein
MAGVNTEEYLGGIIDFTGEVGRYAIQKATDRDEEGVKLCLETDIEVQEAIMQLSNQPPRLQVLFHSSFLLLRFI